MKKHLDLAMYYSNGEADYYYSRLAGEPWEFDRTEGSIDDILSEMAEFENDDGDLEWEYLGHNTMRITGLIDGKPEVNEYPVDVIDYYTREVLRDEDFRAPGQDMSFGEFVNYVAGHIKDYLPEEYQEARVTTRPIPMATYSYLALMVNDGENGTHSINLNEFYQGFQNGRSFDSAMREMADIVQMPQPEYIKSTENYTINGINFRDYESIKPHLFVRLNRPDRAAELEGIVPISRVADMTMTYHVNVNSDENGLANVLVSNELLENLSVTKEQIHKDAINNTYEVLGMQLDTIAGFLEMDQKYSIKDNPLVLTSESRLDGASLIVAQIPGWSEGQTFLNYALMQVNSAEFDEFERAGLPNEECEVNGFYIIPSSIHEVILLPDYGQKIDLAELQEMIMSVNSAMVDERERLSDEPYHWDSAHGIQTAETYLDEVKNDLMYQSENER